jgi:outer membrane lipoprotein-sorting protein
LISHLSKEKGYLPVYYKRTQNFAPTGFETFIQYELSNKGVYFPLRIKKKITNKKLSNNVTFLANFSELKINEDIPDDTFDLYKTIPIGCWIHDNIKGITYVYGKPEEGIK